MQKDAAALAGASAIEFHVSYRLADYLAIVAAHSVADFARIKAGQGKTLSRLDALTLRCCVYLFVPPIFLFKVLRVGACDFRIDSTGIVRSSKSGVVTVPCSDLVAIQEFPVGDLFAKKTGAMPEPYRVLNDIQRSALDAYVARYRQHALVAVLEQTQQDEVALITR
ncbi:hypothetical protein [Janthinobacterium sp. RB2R34]|uniref:hypothetical protein n=1 Tax=Janthinobacterium sp. RB2R34 TaxID=3424193 RepID=UPI003F276698